MGYLAGGEGYYNHAGDFRNGTTPGELPFCLGQAVANNYSSALFAGEVSRIVRAHAARYGLQRRGQQQLQIDKPLFVYLVSGSYGADVHRFVHLDF